MSKQLYALWIFILTVMFAQEASGQNEKDKIVKVAIKAAAESLDYHRECHQPFLFFSIAISFSVDAQVDKVLFSDLPPCMEQSRLDIAANVTKKINALSLSKSLYSNKYVIIASGVLLSEIADVPIYEISAKNWAALFEKIDLKQMVGKELIHIGTNSICVYPRIKN